MRLEEEARIAEEERLRAEEDLEEAVSDAFTGKSENHESSEAVLVVAIQAYKTIFMKHKE